METNSTILEELTNLQEEFKKFKEKFSDFSDLSLKEANRKNTERPFGMLNLPSKGFFYSNKNKFLLIGYLTYFEENILSSEMMQEAEIAMPIILEKVIASNDFNINEILTCDVQAISMYLRAYAYGNNIETEIECSHCNKKDSHTIMISNFKSKDTDLIPDDKGELSITSTRYGKQMKIKPRTYFEEIEFKRGAEKKQAEQMCFYLTEFEGERDKAKILRALYELKIMESRDVKKAIFDSLPGINTTITYTCSYCEKDTLLSFGDNGAGFLKLPGTFINTALEEMFLLSHYGKGISMESIKKMTVGERRWFTNRLSEELTKKKEAEEKAARKARSKSK
jgi:hypothetical protein